MSTQALEHRDKSEREAVGVVQSCRFLAAGETGRHQLTIAGQWKGRRATEHALKTGDQMD